MAPSAFVDVAWLREHERDPSVRIIDARSMPHGVPGLDAATGAQQYDAGHIAGAVHLDYAEHLADAQTPYAARVAPPGAFARTLENSGIGDDTTAVAYDDGDVPYAARFVWMCRYYGHDAAYVLAGGLKEWLASGGTLTQAVPHYAAATFTTRLRPQLRASRDEVLAIANGTSDAQLLETQRDKTYAMRDRDIPNAIRLSGSRLLEDARGGRVAPSATLDKLIAERALDRQKRTIVTCGSGVSASGSYLALLAAGFTDVGVYDGSWMEWSHDKLPTVPKGSGGLDVRQ